jgi:DNA replication protein DnaC
VGPATAQLLAEIFQSKPHPEMGYLSRVDQEWTWRQNRALARRLAQAQFRYRASVEDIDFRLPRGLERSRVRALTQNSAWVTEPQNIFLLGPCGVGKSWLACALAEKACRDGFSACFIRTPKLFRELARARADGSLGTWLARLARTDVLIVDDWAHAPLGDSERRDFLEIGEDRYQTRSTLLTSQLPVAKGHEPIGDPTLADSILDRLVHNAHRLEMSGDSMRKEHGGQKA